MLILTNVAPIFSITGILYPIQRNKWDIYYIQLKILSDSCCVCQCLHVYLCIYVCLLGIYLLMNFMFIHKRLLYHLRVVISSLLPLISNAITHYCIMPVKRQRKCCIITHLLNPIPGHALGLCTVPIVRSIPVLTSPFCIPLSTWNDPFQILSVSNCVLCVNLAKKRTTISESVPKKLPALSTMRNDTAVRTGKIVFFQFIAAGEWCYCSRCPILIVSSFPLTSGQRKISHQFISQQGNILSSIIF